jgi:hypothetical protein
MCNRHQPKLTTYAGVSLFLAARSPPLVGWVKSSLTCGAGRASSGAGLKRRLLPVKIRTVLRFPAQRLNRRPPHASAMSRSRLHLLCWSNKLRATSATEPAYIRTQAFFHGNGVWNFRLAKFICVIRACAPVSGFLRPCRSSCEECKQHRQPQYDSHGDPLLQVPRPHRERLQKSISGAPRRGEKPRGPNRRELSHTDGDSGRLSKAGGCCFIWIAQCADQIACSWCSGSN